MLFLSGFAEEEAEEEELCEMRTDAAVIVEIPADPRKRLDAYNATQKFFQSLAFQSNDCILVSLTVVENNIKTVMTFSCKEYKCKLDVLTEMAKMMNARIDEGAP